MQKIKKPLTMIQHLDMTIYPQGMSLMLISIVERGEAQRGLCFVMKFRRHHPGTKKNHFQGVFGFMTQGVLFSHVCQLDDRN